MLQHRNIILLIGVVKETFCVGLDSARPSLSLSLDVRYMTTDYIPIWVRLTKEDWLKENHTKLIGRSIVVSSGQMLSYMAKESGERVFRIQTSSDKLATTDSVGQCGRVDLIGDVGRYVKSTDGYVFMLTMKTRAGTNHARIYATTAVEEGGCVAVEGNIEFQRSRRFLAVRSDRVTVLK